MSSTVVKPAFRSVCALATATMVRVASGRLSAGYRCTCASIIPGRTVAPLRSITCASAGIATPPPTSVMRSPLIRMTWLLRSVPARLSNIRPARMAITWFGGVTNRVGAPPCECTSTPESRTMAPSAASVVVPIRWCLIRASIEESRVDVSQPGAADDLDALLCEQVVVQPFDPADAVLPGVELHDAAVRINGRRRQRFVERAVQIENGDLLQLRGRVARLEHRLHQRREAARAIRCR